MGGKTVSVKTRVTNTNLTLKYLKDDDFVRSSLPYLVGVKGSGKVTLRFTRMMFFHFEDNYDLLVTSVNGDVNIILAGERSNIKLTFTASTNNSVAATATYDGPRAWVVSSCLNKLVTTLIKEADARAKEAAETSRTTADYSEKLALVSWVSKLLMKSLLLKTEIVSIPKGGLVNYVENLIAEEILQKYRVVYVSGSSDSGTFRLLFVSKSLAGSYVNLGGKEYVGDERALNEFEGIAKVRVYGSMIKDLSELR